jgi:hypothetical protein
MRSAGKSKRKKSSRKKSELNSALDQVTDESVAASMKDFRIYSHKRKATPAS